MISVAVMAHPARESMAYGVAYELARDEPGLVMSHRLRIKWDEGKGEWDTGRRSLLAHHPRATHHLVIQDDAVPCRDLVAGLEKAVTYSHDNPIGLYSGVPTWPIIAKSDGPWAMAIGPAWGVGIVIPVEHIPELVEECDKVTDPERDDYDQRISDFYRKRGIHCWYTVPSLVDHRPGPSLLWPDAEPRVAERFLGRTESALAVDWSQKPDR